MNKIILELEPDELVIIQASMHIMNSDLENSERETKMSINGYRASGLEPSDEVKTNSNELEIFRKLFDGLVEKVEGKLIEIEKDENTSST